MDIQAVKIIRSVRKTLVIQIENNGDVIVRAPKQLSEKRIQMLLNEKDAWLRKNIRKITARENKRIRRDFVEGDEFHYLGKKYILKFNPTAKRHFICDDAFSLSLDAKPKAQQIIEKWYKSRARFVFNDRADFYKELMNAPFATVKLSSAKNRWGSCGAKNTLNFNWRLVMTPIEVIDSVIIHELAHVHHKNHSKDFWAMVRKHCPSYKACDVWLHENHHLLEW